MQAANCGQSGAKQTQPSVMSDWTNKYLKFDEPFFYRDGIFKLVTRYDKCVNV
jgi:hypothetical protein